jgi:threonine aldolase
MGHPAWTRRIRGAAARTVLLHCFSMPQVPHKPTRNFASDNNAGVHPEVIEAIGRANQGHVVAYGDDPFTRAAIAKFEEHFGPGIEVFFTFNGTGANVLGLQALTRSYHAVLCSEFAHIYTDECGAPEKHTGCKLIPLPHQDGKISLDSVRHLPRHWRPASRAGAGHFHYAVHRDGDGL